ncbi:MAG: 26S protease regulatory subunit [Planctomycetota bacterium]
MSLEFHLTHYERYRQEGIDAHRAGKLDRARFCLLKAAEHLFKLSESSQGRLKEERTRRAQELLDMAQSIPASPVAASGRAPGNSGGARRGHAAAPTGGASTSGVREDEEGTDDGDRFIVPEESSVRFEHIAGLDEVKEEIRLKIIYPYQHPEQAKKYGVLGGGGILFYGPPGTGKTFLARAVAGETDCPFYSVKPSEILSKWVGEAEKNVAAMFASARAREKAVIFIDEIEALAPRRSENQSSVMARLVPQILAELEGFAGRREGLLFLGATNEPWSLDPAILRPGRFDERIYIGPPDPPAVLKLLEMNLEDRPLAPDVDLARLAELLRGYTGADIRNLCRKAADRVFRQAIETGTDQVIDELTLLSLVQEVPRSVSDKDLRRFEAYRDGR